MDKAQRDKFWRINEEVESNEKEVLKLEGMIESTKEEIKEKFGVTTLADLQKLLARKKKSRTRALSRIDENFKTLEENYDRFNRADQNS